MARGHERGSDWLLPEADGERGAGTIQVPRDVAVTPGSPFFSQVLQTIITESAAPLSEFSSVFLSV